MNIMNMNKSAAGLALIALVASLSIQEAHAAGARGRQANQGARIRQGVASGQLTHREAAGLRADHRQNARMVDRAKADGDVTARERARIARELREDSRQIFRQKHDGQQRGDGSNLSLRDRNKRQDARIEQGTQSGQLTAKEAAFLKHRDARIQELTRKLAKDGLTAQERVRLQHQRDVLSKQIYHQKHDNQTAPVEPAPAEPAPAEPAPAAQ